MLRMQAQETLCYPRTSTIKKRAFEMMCILVGYMTLSLVNAGLHQPHLLATKNL